MDELKNYKIQLSQVKSLLEIETNDELKALEQDLEEAIELINSQSPTEITEINSNHSNYNLTNEAPITDEITSESNMIYLNSESDDDECESNKKEVYKGQNDVVFCDEENQRIQLNDYDQLIGESYLVPFIVDGKVEMHEAEVIQILEIDDCGDAKLKVRFLYPLNESMKYCSKCIDINCPFNHGYLVNLSMIKDSIDQENLKINSNCLYNRDSEYWSKGKIIDKPSDFYIVRSDSTQELITLKLNEIHFFNYNEEEANIWEEDNKKMNTDDSVKNDFETTYSNSIGLKLLQKQGYQVGEGLGKNKDGIKNPIELSILPANTSLDACIELKNKGYLSTSSESFTHEKQKNYFKNLLIKKNRKKIKQKEVATNEKMFQTLNYTLETKSTQTKSTNIYSRVKNLQNETKNVDNMNIDILHLENEIKKIRNEILRYKKSISLCKEMNQSNLKKLNVKLGLKEGELCTNELKLKLLREKKKRKDYDRNIKYF